MSDRWLGVGIWYHVAVVFKYTKPSDNKDDGDKDKKKEDSGGVPQEESYVRFVINGKLDKSVHTPSKSTSTTYNELR